MKRGTGVLIAVVIAAFVGLGGVASGAGGGAPAIAYVTSTKTGKSTVWVADAQGHNARTLGPGQQPLISPDGKFVAVYAFGTNGVVIYNSSGGVFGKFPSAGAPAAWSSDSRYLAASNFDPTSHGIGHSALAVIDTTTLEATTIAKGFISGTSFSPSSDDTLVFGLYKSSKELTPPVNLFTADPTGGSAPVQLTHDNHSLNPVWGARGIVYDRERARKEAPEYQLFMLSNGHSTQITHIKVDELSAGLVPLAVSADGTKLAAEYGGQDNSEGWAINLVTHKATELANRTNGLVDGGISRDGKTLLIDLGIFEGDPSNKGKVATIPFGGGKPHILIAHGNEPTWDQ